MKNKDNFAKTLALLMKENGFGVKTLAETIGSSKRCIYDLLNGITEPRAVTVHKLANALNVDAYELYKALYITEQHD